MGGGHYDGDVGERSRSSHDDAFEYTQRVSRSSVPRECHPDLNVKDSRGPKVRECRETPEHPHVTPIAIVQDVTLSRGDDARAIYAKTPMFIGQMIMKGYVEHPELCPIGFGNAKTDKAPLQVGQFESDNKFDEWMSKIWLEMGGGGTGQESTELVALYLARYVEMDCLKRGKKGYCFIPTDAGFHPVVSKAEAKEWLGVVIPHDIDSREIFRELQQKWHVFPIYPQKTWEERKADIDQEIRQRVLQAGGMYEGVDIRASLVWNNNNDLDLHIMTPAGEHIFYAARRARCGGELDVDRNAHAPYTNKPVENIRWAKGTAPPGKYRVFVQNYAFHEQSTQGTEYRVELEINGAVQHFEGRTADGAYGERSNVRVHEFTYDPNQRAGAEDVYAGFHDDVILEQWASVIPRERILRLVDPKAIVDVMLGALAINEGTSDLDGYIVDMHDRGQTEKRRAQTRTALEDLASATSLATADTGSLPEAPAPRHGGKSRRL